MLPDVSLVDPDGHSVPLENTWFARRLSLCGEGYAVWQPVEPLRDGATYTLTAGGGGQMLERELIATATPYPTMPLHAGFRLEKTAHEPTPSSEAGCADPRLNDHMVVGWFDLSVELSRPALVVAELRVQDSALGELDSVVSSLAAFDEQPPRRRAFQFEIAQLETSSSCVDVLLRDYRGQPLWSKTACPGDGEMLTFQADVNVIDAPAAPNLEPLDTVAPGGGCQLGDRRGAALPWWLIAVLSSALVRGWRGGRSSCRASRRR